MWKWNICIFTSLRAPPRPARLTQQSHFFRRVSHRRQCAKTHFHLENVCKLCQFFCRVICKHNFLFYWRRCWPHIRAWNEGSRRFHKHGWKRQLVLSHIRHYWDTMLNGAGVRISHHLPCLGKWTFVSSSTPHPSALIDQCMKPNPDP